MKRFLMLAATAIALFGCSDDSDDNSDCGVNNDEIRVSAYLADVKPANSRTAIDGSTGTASWVAGDAIGLFSSEARLTASNVNFTASGSSSLTWATSTPIYWADASTVHKFLAYSPYAGGNTSTATVKLPALTPQTGTINSAQDFLISRNLGTTGVARTSDGAINLIFTHAFSLIQFQVTINSSIASGTTLKSCAFTGGASDKLITSDGNSTIDLSTGAITTSGTTANTITATPSSAPTLSSTVVNFFIVVLPGTYAPTVQFALTEGGATITVPTASIASTAYAAGNKYTYTVNISRTAISISNPTITDWTNNSSGSISGGI